MAQLALNISYIIISPLQTFFIITIGLHVSYKVSWISSMIYKNDIYDAAEYCAVTWTQQQQLVLLSTFC